MNCKTSMGRVLDFKTFSILSPMSIPFSWSSVRSKMQSFFEIIVSIFPPWHCQLMLSFCNCPLICPTKPKKAFSEELIEKRHLGAYSGNCGRIFGIVERVCSCQVKFSSENLYFPLFEYYFPQIFYAKHTTSKLHSNSACKTNLAFSVQVIKKPFFGC